MIDIKLGYNFKKSFIVFLKMVLKEKLLPKKGLKKYKNLHCKQEMKPTKFKSQKYKTPAVKGLTLNKI